ncbi:ATP-binding protein [Streptomyces violaceorubidus]|uniref:AAA family ATPase n=1 Tax=Streptomyces violaceorubidus TaxID=284042 RepID=A0ABV1SW67_9ACTN
MNHPRHARPPSRLIGRSQDLAALRSRLTGTADAALLLSGEAGAGKTALLDALAAELGQDGVRVLRASGAQFETDIGYSGLNQLLMPLLDSLDRLDEGHRDALRVAVGVGGGPPPSRLLISTAVLLLLRSMAEDHPLCLVVDDLPWLDRATLSVLGFVVRRLAGSRVGFLAAARTGTDSFFETGLLTEYRVQPLDDTSSAALVARAHPAMAPTVRRRIVAEARGNPLALVELPAALDRDQREARRAVPAVLPLGERLQALFAARVGALPAPTRELLLLAALDGTGDLATVEAAAGRAVLDDLAPAERDRLVRVSAFPQHLSFAHPLIGAAVVTRATAADRRRAHQALAGVLGDRPERRAHHLGEATAHPDETVALRLEEAARLRLGRGDAFGAVAALTRAAELSPDAADVARRLAEAAYIGADSGDLSAASRLLAGARQADPGGRRSLHAAAASAFLLINGEGDIGTAHRLLVGAIETGDHHYDASDGALVDALFTLTMLCWYGGDPLLWRPLLRALDRLTPAPPDLLWVCVQTFGDPARTGPAALPRLDALLDDIGSDAARTVRIGTCSLYPDRLADSRRASYRLVEQGRAGATPARRHIAALIHLAQDHYDAGLWDEATDLADEGTSLCEEHNHRYFTGKFQYVRALVAAATGDTETAARLAEDIVRWAAPRGAHGLRALADHVRGLAALGRGDAETAWHHARALTPPGTLAPYLPQAMAGTLDLVEAAVRTGRHAEAAAHARAVRESAMADLSPRLRLLALACEALTTPGDAALPLFDRALAAVEPGRWPFDTARVHLLYGERLRRRRAAKEARDHLLTALDTFEELGARPWADRARTELRAGGAGAGTAASGRTALTPQERQIATLAASGLTNKQIAERLFLSHRTIGTHLYQLYRKLGISSRTALRDALDLENVR